MKKYQKVLLTSLVFILSGQSTFAQQELAELSSKIKVLNRQHQISEKRATEYYGRLIVRLNALKDLELRSTASTTATGSPSPIKHNHITATQLQEELKALDAKATEYDKVALAIHYKLQDKLLELEASTQASPSVTASPLPSPTVPAATLNREIQALEAKLDKMRREELSRILETEERLISIEAKIENPVQLARLAVALQESSSTETPQPTPSQKESPKFARYLSTRLGELIECSETERAKIEESIAKLLEESSSRKGLGADLRKALVDVLGESRVKDLETVGRELQQQHFDEHYNDEAAKLTARIGFDPNRRAEIRTALEKAQAIAAEKRRELEESPTSNSDQKGQLDLMDSLLEREAVMQAMKPLLNESQWNALIALPEEYWYLSLLPPPSEQDVLW